MKKDKKFLLELENELGHMNKKDKNMIIEKYSNIIKNRLSNKEKIKSIIKDLGDPKIIAQKEKQIIKNNNKLSKMIKRIKIKFLEIYKKICEFFKKIKKNIKNSFKKSSKKHKKIKKTKENKKIDDDNIKDTSIIIKSEEEINNSSSNYKKRNKFFVIIESIILLIMLLIWLYINVIFISSIFALLDGVKLYGITISLFGLGFLIFLILISLFKNIFQKGKSLFKLTIIMILVSILIIALGISLTILKLYRIDNINDVSQKYSMNRIIEKYILPKDNQKMYITFNSNYDTQYIVNYDDNLNGQFKLEVGYYECYYDYFVKKTTNNIYVSLKKDKKDIISAFIDDLKENKIYDSDELSRYIVKITISKKDYERLVIQN